MKVVDIILEYVMLLQGFPDLSVIRDDDPHLFLDVGEVIKTFQCMLSCKLPCGIYACASNQELITGRSVQFENSKT